MATQIVECVPNFSEGRRKEVIQAIAEAISKTDGVTLLDVDPGASTNRTVYTFVGNPEAVVEGALAATRVAAAMIDMSSHHGEHPRMGALDVCPFIPVQGVTMEDCVMCANRFAGRLAHELGVPVYLYGEAAVNPTRKALPNVRSGEYEGLIDKLVQPEWAPDYGPADFVPSWGATAAGARKFLIAYNVNLLATKEQAHRIALNIREKGRGNGAPGKFKHLQAIGWFLEESNLAQISINITDMDETPLHMVYEECKKQAKDLQLPVAGSEIVGMVPIDCVIKAADFYMEQENLFILEEDQKIRLVIEKLGLHSMKQFAPKEKIIELMLKEDGKPKLIEKTVKQFVRSVGSRTPAPGGGSVSALVAAMGAALGTMVGLLSYGKRQFEDSDAQMRKIIPPLHDTMNILLPCVDKDTEAFNEYMLALKLPKTTPEEAKLRSKAMELGLKTAILVPLNVAKTANQVWGPLKELANLYNVTTKSDLQVAARTIETGVWGAYYNLMINLKSMDDEEFKASMKEAGEEQIAIAREGCAAVLVAADERERRT